MRIRFKTFRRPKWYFFALCLTGIICYIIYNTTDKLGEIQLTEEDAVIIYWSPQENNILCHNSKEDDALPSASEPSFSPGPKSIYFHETSCRGGIDSRQACSVESAARAHPAWEVYLLFNSPVTHHMLAHSCLSKLLKFPNVKVGRVHADEYSRDSVVHSVVVDQLKQSLHPVEHTADIMKMLSLNKFGGVYLDLDQVVVKPFDSLPRNWIARESNQSLASGAMAFSNKGIGKNITSAVLTAISESYDPETFAGNGAPVIHSVLRKMCRKRCKGLKVFNAERFYPLNFTLAYLYFFGEHHYTDYLKSHKIFFTHHLWNPLTKMYTVSNQSMFFKIAQIYCPTIYNIFGNEFGI